MRLGDNIAVLAQGARLQQFAPPARLLAEPANDFVREFVGADRGIMLLAVTPIPRDGLRALSSVDGSVDALPAVPVTASLQDALAAMLVADTAAVVVRDGESALGVLTPADVHRALHT